MSSPSKFRSFVSINDKTRYDVGDIIHVADDAEPPKFAIFKVLSKTKASYNKYMHDIRVIVEDTNTNKQYVTSVFFDDQRGWEIDDGDFYPVDKLDKSVYLRVDDLCAIMLFAESHNIKETCLNSDQFKKAFGEAYPELTIHTLLDDEDGYKCFVVDRKDTLFGIREFKPANQEFLDLWKRCQKQRVHHMAIKDGIHLRVFENDLKTHASTVRIFGKLKGRSLSIKNPTMFRSQYILRDLTNEVDVINSDYYSTDLALYADCFRWSHDVERMRDMIEAGKVSSWDIKVARGQYPNSREGYKEYLLDISNQRAIDASFAELADKFIELDDYYYYGSQDESETTTH